MTSSPIVACTSKAKGPSRAQVAGSISARQVFRQYRIDDSAKGYIPCTRSPSRGAESRRVGIVELSILSDLPLEFPASPDRSERRRSPAVIRRESEKERIEFNSLNFDQIRVTKEIG